MSQDLFSSFVNCWLLSRACSEDTLRTSPIGDRFQLYCCLLSAELLLLWFGLWQKFSAGMNRLHKTQQALVLAKDNTWCVRWNQFDLTVPASHGLILLLVEWAGSAGPQNEGHSVLADQTLTAFIQPLCRSLFSWSVSSCLFLFEWSICHTFEYTMSAAPCRFRLQLKHWQPCRLVVGIPLWGKPHDFLTSSDCWYMVYLRQGTWKQRVI